RPGRKQGGGCVLCRRGGGRRVADRQRGSARPRGPGVRGRGSGPLAGGAGAAVRPGGAAGQMGPGGALRLQPGGLV
ncbi:RNHCP domain-containing protein, partial [Dysosmobacter welbionis]